MSAVSFSAQGEVMSEERKMEAELEELSIEDHERIEQLKVIHTKHQERIARLEVLLKKHYERTLPRGERVLLHTLLKKKYAFGDKMPDYRCLNCDKPMVYTWKEGPICAYRNGGCGYKPL